MATKSKISLTAAAFMTCASGLAHATTVSQTKSTGPISKGASFTQTFLGFVPANFAALGIPAGAVLDSVTDTLSESFTGSITLKNNNTTGPAGSFTSLALVDTAVKTLAGTLTVTTKATGAPTLTGSLGAGATVSGGQTGAASASASSVAIAAFQVASITGSGSTSIVRTGTVGFNNSETDAGTGSFTDVLVYNFHTSPVTSTPEPATLTLLGSGLIGLGLARLARRRRKQ